MESGGDFLPTVVQQEAEVNRKVEVDSKNVGFNSRAEADGGLEVGKVFEQSAARRFRRLADVEVDEAENVSADAELEGVGRAFAPARLRGFRARAGLRSRGLRGRPRARAAGGGDGEEEEVEGEEESKRG